MAASGRLYTMGFQNVTLAAAQDALAVYAGSSKIFGVHRVVLSQKTAVTPSFLRVRLRYLPVTVTAGSVGNAGTIKPIVPGDAAATITGRINDTTQATSSGTIVDLCDDDWSLLNGFIWEPAVLSRPPLIAISGALIVSVDDAPASIVASGYVTVEEMP